MMTREVGDKIMFLGAFIKTGWTFDEDGEQQDTLGF